MVTGFALLILGGILVEAGISGRSLSDVMQGLLTANHRLKLKLPDELSNNIAGGTTSDFTDTVLGLGAAGSLKGKTPRQIVDQQVIPIARKHGVNQSSGSVAAANARHGPTVSGGRSDHQGNGNDSWADDMPVATDSKQGDDLAKELAQTFGFSTYKGLQTVTHDGFRMQLIWRTNEGGNHHNHVHFGIRKV